MHVNPTPRILGKLCSPPSALLYLALNHSAFFLAALFVFLAFQTSNFWFLLAVPLSYLDFRTSSTVLTAFHFLMWLPLALLGLLLKIWWLPAGSALLWMAGGFTVTKVIASFGLGATQSHVQQSLLSSEELFVWAYRTGAIAILDSADSWKRYEHEGDE
ncbi:MAG TPA: hypothetical protein VJ725_19730 [Thermoanaerobaculia bacterium]|nr:hypothetical protein [Thermoanaerobaculia bacterium]